MIEIHWFLALMVAILFYGLGHIICLSGKK